MKKDLVETKKNKTPLKTKEEKAAERAKLKKDKQYLNDMFIMMGKDPKKMRKL